MSKRDVYASWILVAAMLVGIWLTWVPHFATRAAHEVISMQRSAVELTLDKATRL